MFSLTGTAVARDAREAAARTANDAFMVNKSSRVYGVVNKMKSAQSRNRAF